MLPKNIIVDGKEYVLMKKIKTENKRYVEYRCDEISKIKFFEYIDGSLNEVSDKEDLKKVIKEKYVIKE